MDSDDSYIPSSDNLDSEESELRSQSIRNAFTRYLRNRESTCSNIITSHKRQEMSRPIKLEELYSDRTLSDEENVESERTLQEGSDILLPLRSKVKNEKNESKHSFNQPCIKTEPNHGGPTATTLLREQLSHANSSKFQKAETKSEVFNPRIEDIKRRLIMKSIRPPRVIPAENEKFATPIELMKTFDLLNRAESADPITIDAWLLFEKIEDHTLQLLESSVTEKTLQNTKFLRKLGMFLNGDLKTEIQFPELIAEDLTRLHKKWSLGDLSCVSMRGLVKGKKGRYGIDPTWSIARSDDYFGNGNLVNGQTWIGRMAMNRDAAHSQIQGGISGDIRSGARSIVMSDIGKGDTKQYQNVDRDEVIFYCGDSWSKKLADGAKFDMPARGTRALLVSTDTGNPIRVFRCCAIPKLGVSGPASMYRYDGLYKSVSYEILSVRRQEYRFKLVRITEDQGPLRWKAFASVGTQQKRKMSNSKTDSELLRKGKKRRL